MNVIIFLLIISLTAAISFLFAYIWSVKSGQFDDNYSPAQRILFDDISVPVSAKTIIPQEQKPAINNSFEQEKKQIIQNENQK